MSAEHLAWSKREDSQEIGEDQLSAPALGKPSPVTLIRNPCLSLLPDRGARPEERGLCWEKPAPSASGAPGGISGYLLPLLLC